MEFQNIASHAHRLSHRTWVEQSNGKSANMSQQPSRHSDDVGLTHPLLTYLSIYKKRKGSENATHVSQGYKTGVSIISRDKKF